MSVLNRVPDVSYYFQIMVVSLGIVLLFYVLIFHQKSHLDAMHQQNTDLNLLELPQFSPALPFTIEYKNGRMWVHSTEPLGVASSQANLDLPSSFMEKTGLQEIQAGNYLQYGAHLYHYQSNRQKILRETIFLADPSALQSKLMIGGKYSQGGVLVDWKKIPQGNARQQWALLSPVQQDGSQATFGNNVTQVKVVAGIPGLKLIRYGRKIPLPMVPLDQNLSKAIRKSNSSSVVYAQDADVLLGKHYAFRLKIGKLPEIGSEDRTQPFELERIRIENFPEKLLHGAQLKWKGLYFQKKQFPFTITSESANSTDQTVIVWGGLSSVFSFGLKKPTGQEENDPCPGERKETLCLYNTGIGTIVIEDVAEQRFIKPETVGVVNAGDQIHLGLKTLHLYQASNEGDWMLWSETASKVSRLSLYRKNRLFPQSLRFRRVGESYLPQKFEERAFQALVQQLYQAGLLTWEKGYLILKPSQSAKPEHMVLFEKLERAGNRRQLERLLYELNRKVKPVGLLVTGHWYVRNQKGKTVHSLSSNTNSWMAAKPDVKGHWPQTQPELLFPSWQPAVAPSHAPPVGRVEQAAVWIWYPEVWLPHLRKEHQMVRYFAKQWKVPNSSRTARLQLELKAAGALEVFLNGKRIARSSQLKQNESLHSLQVNRPLYAGHQYEVVIKVSQSPLLMESLQKVVVSDSPIHEEAAQHLFLLGKSSIDLAPEVIVHRPPSIPEKNPIIRGKILDHNRDTLPHLVVSQKNSGIPELSFPLASTPHQKIKTRRTLWIWEGASLPTLLLWEGQLGKKKRKTNHQVELQWETQARTPYLILKNINRWNLFQRNTFTTMPVRIQYCNSSKRPPCLASQKGIALDQWGAQLSHPHLPEFSLEYRNTKGTTLIGNIWIYDSLRKQYHQFKTSELLYEKLNNELAKYLSGLAFENQGNQTIVKLVGQSSSNGVLIKINKATVLQTITGKSASLEEGDRIIWNEEWELEYRSEKGMLADSNHTGRYYQEQLGLLPIMGMAFGDLRSGLEYSFDHLLSQGINIKLTLDDDLQRFVRDETLVEMASLKEDDIKLAEMLKNVGDYPGAGQLEEKNYEAGVVVMNADSGAILAAVSEPSAAYTHLTPEYLKLWQKQPDSSNPLNNRVWGKGFSPGSVSKLITSLAALRAVNEQQDPDNIIALMLEGKLPDGFLCPQPESKKSRNRLKGKYLPLPSAVQNNYQGFCSPAKYARFQKLKIHSGLKNYGTSAVLQGFGLPDALSHSLNTYFAYLSLLLHQQIRQGQSVLWNADPSEQSDWLLQTASLLGFNKTHSLLPGSLNQKFYRFLQRRASLLQTNGKQQTVDILTPSPGVFSAVRTDMSSTAFRGVGQTIYSTPLLNALIGEVIAKRGLQMPPFLIQAIGTTSFAPEPIPSLIELPERDWKMLEQGMAQVVRKPGRTAYLAFQTNPWSSYVWGKTGTAERSKSFGKYRITQRSMEQLQKLGIPKKLFRELKQHHQFYPFYTKKAVVEGLNRLPSFQQLSKSSKKLWKQRILKAANSPYSQGVFKKHQAASRFDDSWFLCFIRPPQGSPLVLSILIAQGGTGGSRAAVLASRLVRRIGDYYGWKTPVLK